MQTHQQVLISAIKASSLPARDIANLSGVNGSVLSRFLNGKQDLKAGDYFAVLYTLPEASKKFALAKLGMGEFDYPSLVLGASSEEKAEILTVLAGYISHNNAEVGSNVDASSFAQAV